MTDFVTLFLKAGDGGRGKVSFRREKYAPRGGPDGGNGGDGGNIIIRADKGLSTLRAYAGKVEFVATPGAPGEKRNKSGARGEDLILSVPVGTQITILGENEVAERKRMELGFGVLRRRREVKLNVYLTGWEADGRGLTATTQKQAEGEVIEYQNPVPAVLLSEDGQEIIICQGGFGGRGNDAFKSSTRTTPLMAEQGSEAEARMVTFELKLLADVGLVGLPNAGKSTLLSVLTKARPKIASYPFTTLEPNLGIATISAGAAPREIVIADIPGLIEGASEGKGLGHEFLRHVENCVSLVYLLYLEEKVVFDQDLTDAQKAEALLDQMNVLKNELKAHSSDMLKKESLVVVNKSDLLSEALTTQIEQLFKNENGVKPLFISAATGVGLDDLTTLLANQTNK